MRFLIQRHLLQTSIRRCYLPRLPRPAKLSLYLQAQNRLSSTKAMSNDDDYAAFLDKANQDTGSATTESKSDSVKITAVNTDVPASLKEVDEFLVSDSDEPFEPVSLKYEQDALPSADALGKLMGIKKLATIQQKDFDPRDQYKSIVEAVKKAGNGEVGYFKADIDRTRAQYVIVSIDTKHKRLVGLKALAVES